MRKTRSDAPLLGPSNKMLGINFRDVIEHNRRTATLFSSFYPVRGRLHIRVKVFNPTTYTPLTCDICEERGGIRCKDKIIRCGTCRARYARYFRMKIYIQRTLE